MWLLLSLRREFIIWPVALFRSLFTNNYRVLEMPYSLCVLGCGTMGISILSGVIDNISSPNAGKQTFDDESAPSTPMGSMILEAKASSDSLPDRYENSKHLKNGGESKRAGGS